MIPKTLIAAGLALALALSGAANAGEKPVLNVLTYDSFVSDWGPGPAVKKAFEATCDCTLNFTTAGDGAALLARVRLEGKRSKADIVLGLDTSLTAQAAATGLFVPTGISLPKTLDIPGGWTDKLFLPFDWGYFAFVYDKTKLKNPPRSFEQLIKAPDSLKIVIEDPRSSTPGLGLLYWIKAEYGTRAPEIWAGLAPHILTVTKGWSQAYGMFLKGEADMVLSYTTSPAYHIIEEKDHSKAAAIFKGGHYMQIEVAGELATAPHPALAKKFLKFMLSDTFQSIIPTTNWMYPAIRLKGGLPQAFETQISPSEALLLAPDQVLALRQQALDEWLTALSK